MNTPGPQIGLSGVGSFLVVSLLLIAATVTATQSDDEKRSGPEANRSAQREKAQGAEKAQSEAKAERVRSTRRRQLVGDWIGTGAAAVDLNIQKDGKFRSSFHRVPGTPAVTPESGVWILDGKSLIREILESPVESRVGLKLTHRIKRLDAKSLRIESSDGVRASFVRANVEPASTDFSLQLALASDDRIFSAGDRVTLELSLQNRSSREQKVSDFVPLLGWTPRLFDSRGREILFTIPAIDIGVQARTTVLSKLRTAVIGKYAFQLPKEIGDGTYSVTQVYRIRVDTKSLELTSNPIQLRIGEIPPKESAQAPSGTSPKPTQRKPTAPQIAPLQFVPVAPIQYAPPKDAASKDAASKDAAVEKLAMKEAEAVAAEAEIQVAELALRQAELGYEQAKKLASRGFISEQQLAVFELELAAQKSQLADLREGRKQGGGEVSAAELLLLEAALRRATAEHEHAKQLADRGYISKRQLAASELRLAELERQLADRRAVGFANLRQMSQRYSLTLAESERVKTLVNRGLVPLRSLEALTEQVAELSAKRDRLRAQLGRTDRPIKTEKADKDDMVRAHYPSIAGIEYGMSEAKFRELLVELELPPHPTKAERLTKYVFPTTDEYFLRFVFDNDQLTRIQRLPAEQEKLPQGQGKAHRISHQNHVTVQLFYSEDDSDRKVVMWSDGGTITAEMLKETFQRLQQNGLQVEPRVEIQALRTLRSGDVTETVKVMQQAGFEHIVLSQLSDATYRVLPAVGETGSVHGEIRWKDERLKKAAFELSLRPSKWESRNGEPYSLKLSESGAFEFRNVPTGKCVIIATATVPTGNADTTVFEKKIEFSVVKDKTTKVFVDFN